MKRFLLITGLLIFSCISAVAAPPDWYGQPVMAIYGRYGPTITYTMTNDTAVTLQAAYVAAGGTWASNGLNPVGFLIACETNAGRIGLGGTTPTVDNVGIPIAALGNGQFIAIDAADNTKITNSTAGSNAKFHITPIYQK
jgi:hypothetical protein